MQADAAPPGVVELREDIPLKPGGGGGGASCGGGPRLIAGCFAALTAAVTVALLTQIYYGDYEVVPHGAVSAPAAACSAAGTGALKAGGRAADAAAAAALCLALLAPHKTSLDASGSLLYWEYRTARGAGPTLMEWGGPEDSGGPDSPDGTGGTGGTGGPGGPDGPPRLLAALAALHSRWGALPWHRVLQPTIDLARSGFEVSEELSAARAQAAAPRWEPGALRTDEPFAAYLEALQRNTSAELWSAWRGRGARVREAAARSAAAGAWRLHAGGAGAEAAARALGLALDPPPASVDDAEARVVKALVAEAALGAWPPSGAGLAAGCGLAVVDRLDTYLALVTGLSVPFGSEAATGAGAGVEARDRPVAPLDLAPAILVDDHVCGVRAVAGAEASGALAQAAAALAAMPASGADAVERPRQRVLRGGALRPDPPGPPAPGAGAASGEDAARRRAAVNLVVQHGDALQSHADGRGGGFASRF